MLSGIDPFAKQLFRTDRYLVNENQGADTRARSTLGILPARCLADDDKSSLVEFA
jgi:hypothetical protein